LYATTPDMNKIEIGKFGEKYAADFLRSQGYRILTTNFRARFGEIDLIALDILNSRQLVFVEVKTRTDESFGLPQESVTYSKKTKLLKTALHFLSVSREKTYSGWRIDVIAVKLDEQYRLKDINHFKNIFNG